MILFLDVETSSFDYLRGSVIQIGAILCKDNGDKISEFMEYGRPHENWWDQGAEIVHSITHPQAMRFQSQSLMVDKFASFIAPFWGKNITVEHSNNFYDYKHIEHTFLKVDRLYDWRRFAMIENSESTLKIARKKVQSESYKLGRLCKMYNINLKNAHDALEDANACRELYLKLKTM